MTENHGVGGSIPPLGTTSFFAGSLAACLTARLPLSRRVRCAFCPRFTGNTTLITRCDSIRRICHDPIIRGQTGPDLDKAAEVTRDRDGLENNPIFGIDCRDAQAALVENQ